jgi:hypothetical protein
MKKQRCGVCNYKEEKPMICSKCGQRSCGACWDWVRRQCATCTNREEKLRSYERSGAI